LTTLVRNILQSAKILGDFFNQKLLIPLVHMFGSPYKDVKKKVRNFLLFDD
jgi:hypothetical protein